MATHSTAYTEIGRLVDKYILMRGLQQDDYFSYLQMACNCYRDISLRHSNKTATTKIAVSALGIIEMPTDMVGFGGLYIPIGGELWSFTRRSSKVMTTTTTLGVEGQDAEVGEGVNVSNSQSLGFSGRGGVNDYYMSIDWTNRRIFCDGFKSDTAILIYTSSGLVVAGNTYVSQECEAPITAYIDWQKEINNIRSISMLQILEKYYNDRLFELRLINFMPSRDEIADAFDSGSTQAVQR